MWRIVEKGGLGVGLRGKKVKESDRFRLKLCVSEEEESFAEKRGIRAKERCICSLSETGSRDGFGLVVVLRFLPRRDHIEPFLALDGQIFPRANVPMIFSSSR